MAIEEGRVVDLRNTLTILRRYKPGFDHLVEAGFVYLPHALIPLRSFELRTSM